MSGPQWRWRVGALAFALGLLSLWQALAALEWISPLFFPPPWRTLQELASQVGDGSLLAPLASTLARMAYGWLAASVLGVVLGALIASSAWRRHLLMPTLESLRPLPASAVLPLAVLAFGLSDAMSTAVIAFGSLWPILLASVHGFATLDERLEDVCAALGLSHVERLCKVALPGALPDILSGAQVGLSVALILAVVTEMQASLPGVGQNILLAQRAFQSPALYAGVLTLGSIGIAASMALRMLERRLLRWRADA